MPSHDINVDWPGNAPGSARLARYRWVIVWRSTYPDGGDTQHVSEIPADVRRLDDPDVADGYHQLAQRLAGDL